MGEEGGYQPVDERFRSLPGIAIGEKTVYETEDLPESDRSHRIVGVTDNDDRSNGDIELIRIDPADAFIKLQGRLLDPGFTTRQDISEAAKGYSIFATEIHGVGEAPTVDDSINRRFSSIKDQIRQLQNDIYFVEQFRSETLSDEESQQFSNVRSQLDDLEQQLSSMRSTSGADAAGKSSSRKAPKNSAESRIVADDELLARNIDPDAGSSARAVLDLASRLRVVEDALGGPIQIKQWSSSSARGDAGGIGSSTSSIDSVLGAVTMLKNQMSLLDAENIEFLDHRLKTFTDRIEQAMRKRQTLADDTVKRVNQVYDKLKTIDQASYAVPGALERLSTLSQSLKQAQSFGSEFAEMSRSQDELLQKYVTSNELVENMLKEFPKRAEVVEAKLNQMTSSKKS